MATLSLSGGAYQARSVIASAQRSLNLFGEPMPQQQGEPAKFAHYPTPGLTLLGTLPQGGIRGLRQASNDAIYAVAGSGVYLVNNATTPWTGTLIGSITAGRTTPVSMMDNGTTMVIVDGSTNGWQVDLPSHGFSAISDPTGSFVGADRVAYLDTYFLFNKPGTPQFYASLSNSVTFDPLYFANKTSYPDNIVSVAVAKREIWLIGERTSEVWYNAGTPDFPFGQIPSTFIDHGCVAKYSVVVYDNSVLWLAQSRSGATFVLQGAGYETKRVSTFAVEQAWSDYTIADAAGYVYQLGGHVVYVLTFPTTDRTWCYDISTGLWHEWAWTDAAGAQHRCRAVGAYGYANWGTPLAGDWQNGNLYLIDHNNYTDNGAPIVRQRAFPHLLNEGKRVFHRSFTADFETGMAGPLPTRPTTQMECLFDGPDGTPVENYSPSSGEFNASWLLTSGAGAVLSGNKAIAVDGNTAYASRGSPPTIADYSIAFRVWSNSLREVDGSSALMAGRGTDTTAWLNGYIGGIQLMDGVWVATLAGGSAARLGVQIGLPPPNGFYDCLLSMVGTAISLTVQRSPDGNYLRPNGQWQSTPVAAIAMTDSRWTTPGRIMLGLNAVPTGVIGTEDATGTWVAEDGSASSWEWDDVPTDSLAIDNIVVTTIPSPWMLSLDWSDNRGHTYGNPVPTSMGGAGDYRTSVQWQRLGYCRDRTYRLTWTSALPTALQGAWITADPASS